MQNKIYKKSVVVFLDLLGITDRIKETQENEEGAKAILSIYKQIKAWIKDIENGAKKEWEMPIKAKAMSDSIVITCDIVSEKSILLIAYILALLQIGTMRSHFLIRGAMSIGGIYDRRQIFFGPAFIKAYELEKIASWPRIVIDTSVIEVLDKKSLKSARQSYIRQDNTGLYYFNYLHLFFTVEALRMKQSLQKNRKAAIYFIDMINKHKEYIIEMTNIIKEKQRFDLLRKYHAVADYHNEFLNELLINLPKTLNYKDVDAKTTTGILIGIFKEIASSRKGLNQDDIETILEKFTESLFKDYKSLTKCKIDLEKEFQQLYASQ